MKSQALIIQFIIFFTIGLAFFLAVGNLFRFQSNLIKREILNLDSELTNKYLSALIITAVDNCKSCNKTSIQVNVKSVVGFNPVFKLDTGIVLSIRPENKILQSSIQSTLLNKLFRR